MSSVNYLRFNEISPNNFLVLLNSKKIRKYLLEHALFTIDRLLSRINSKIEVAANSGCKVKVIVCEGVYVY